MYWYQSRDRVVATEFKAKFYVVADALRYNRTDTALVRVVLPIVNNDIDGSTKAAIDFIQSFYAPPASTFPHNRVARCRRTKPINSKSFRSNTASLRLRYTHREM